MRYGIYIVFPRGQERDGPRRLVIGPVVPAGKRTARAGSDWQILLRRLKCAATMAGIEWSRCTWRLLAQRET